MLEKQVADVQAFATHVANSPEFAKHAQAKFSYELTMRCQQGLPDTVVASELVQYYREVAALALLCMQGLQEE